MIEQSQHINSHLAEICKNSDVVARQFLFSDEELADNAVVLDDPIGDDSNSPVRGIVHRYDDRVLLMPNLSCPSICRFCFRKTKIGKEPALTEMELEAALGYIQSHEEIFEVILSGGEPLQSFNGLQRIIDKLEQIDHVAVIRIHTRLPLTAPAEAASFFDDAKLRFTKPIHMVIHCNHADEITPQWKTFVQQAHENGLILLSQSVLLAGVNDSVEALENLFRTLLRNRVKPYYLHHTDQVVGTDHFRVPLAKGRELFNQLRGRLSGLAIPRYVLDIPSGKGKVSAEQEVISEAEDHFKVTTPTETINYHG